jgi:hypothetical protein
VANSRGAERLTGLNRNTIMRLLVLAGERCEKLMDKQMRELPCRRIQCDEIWTFLMKKARHVRKGDRQSLATIVAIWAFKSRKLL